MGRRGWRGLSALTLASLTLVCFGVTACSADHTRVARRNGPDTVVVRSQQEPDRLNPLLSDAISAADVCRPMMNGLIGVSDKLEYFPDLVTVLPTPENGLVRREGAGMAVTYKLRPNVRFHDGAPFSSHDVWFAWQLVMNPKTLVVSREGYDKIAGIDTPDPLTAVVHFKEPYAPYLTLFGMILPSHILEQSEDVNLDPFNRAPVGTGPYKFKEWVSGNHVALEANPDYFGGAPRIKQLYFKFVPDDNASFIQLANGDIDVYPDFNLDQIKPIKRFEHLQLESVPSLTYEHLALNLDKPVFKERAVRRALAYSINKPEIARTIYKGMWQIAHTTEHPLSWSYNPKFKEPYPYDPAKAKALLDEAGWQVGADGVRAKHGVRLSFTITSTTGRKAREQLEQVLAGYFKAIGAELKIQNVQGGLLFAGYPTGLLQSGKYDMALFARTTALDPSANLSVWHSRMLPPEGQNTVRYKNAELDRVLEEGNRELRFAERQRLYWKMSELLVEDVPIIPIVYWNETNGVNRALKNFRPNPTSRRFAWNTEAWSLEEQP